MTDLTGARWRKSTRSGDNGGNCIEVADDLPDLVAVRDSKDRSGPALRFRPEAWAAFIAAKKLSRPLDSRQSDCSGTTDPLAGWTDATA